MDSYRQNVNGNLTPVWPNLQQMSKLLFKQLQRSATMAQSCTEHGCDSPGIVGKHFVPIRLWYSIPDLWLVSYSSYVGWNQFKNNKMLPWPMLPYPNLYTPHTILEMSALYKDSWHVIKMYTMIKMNTNNYLNDVSWNCFVKAVKVKLPLFLFVPISHSYRIKNKPSIVITFPRYRDIIPFNMEDMSRKAI